jgi:adenylate cyclase
VTRTLIVVAAVVAVCVGVAVAAWRIRVRRLRCAEEERRRAEEEARRLSSIEASGLLGLATVEGIRVARLALPAGIEAGVQGLAPVVAGSLRSLADRAESERPKLRRVLSADGTVSLMFSDIEGSTALNERLGDEGWLKLLAEHNELIRRRVRVHRGQIVKTLGDSFMVAFKSISDALTCAIELQQALGGHGGDPEVTVRVRIGLHSGEVTRQGYDLLGINVALAARVASEAGGGEILVSSAARTLATGERLPIGFGRARTVQLKGISEAETVYPVLWSPAVVSA